MPIAAGPPSAPEALRKRVIDPDRKRVLVARLSESEQAMDLSIPANCNGLGRIRHFHRQIAPEWPDDPLPIDPAALAVGHSDPDMVRAQVFQLAACNWRCWYCFVDYSLLSANSGRGEWLTAANLIDLYQAEKNPPTVIDLSGGHPELVPEWVVWTMEELERRHLASRVYLWSDDNLSCDFFWRFLTKSQIDLIASYQNYGRVGCFKGFDPVSFGFNTSADESLFDRQFELFRKLLNLGIDLYAYVTLTTPQAERIPDLMATFVDRLQEIHEYLPLRTVPLLIKEFSPVSARMTPQRHLALENQWRAVEAWETERQRRFTGCLLSQRIASVTMNDKG